MTSGYIQTLRGPVAADALGRTLPHEHLFVDLRGPFVPGYAQADPERVVKRMQPYLDELAARGVTALVDCAPPGVGRSVPVLQRLAAATPIHIIAPTGVYKEGFIPTALLDLTPETLAELWVRELTEGMDGTDCRAGFIKVALSDTGPTAIEVRNLQAAALASQQTGAVVASHTIGEQAIRREVEVLARAGQDLRRFIWVHAHTVVGTAVHIEIAQRGVWLEFDAIGADQWMSQPVLLDSVIALIEAGYADQLLLSHDAGWYDPAQPDGIPQPDGIRGYTVLFDHFIPALRARGVTDAVIDQITRLPIPPAPLRWPEVGAGLKTKIHACLRDKPLR